MKKTLKLAVISIMGFCYSSEAQATEVGCKASPNCVSSLSAKQSHYIEPLRVDLFAYRENPDKFMAHLQTLIMELPRVDLLEATDDFLHFTFKSRIFRFKDDVYFWVSAEKNQIDWKSESRVGYSDFGANKKRLERLRALLASHL